MGFLSQLGNFDYRGLGLVQRVLLACDGTLGDVIEATFLEPVELMKIAQTVSQSPAGMEKLNLGVGELVMERKIVMLGKLSRRNYVYAESYLALDRLPITFRRDLELSTKTIGRIWAEHRIDSRKELIHVSRDPVGGLTERFGSGTTLIKRSYRLLSGGWPMMLISEYFPENYDPASENGVS